MFLILSLLYLCRRFVHAVPLSATPAIRDAFELTSSAERVCPNQRRSVWDIVWSCLATIFACSWVSVHPNIPPSGEKWWQPLLRRLELMFWAIIAPEMIILWAMRQWFGARNLAREYHGMKQWTKTHGYFIQMGGFTLYKGEESQGVLNPDKMKELLGEGKIEFPTITEEQVRDRSKGDGLSKALAIGQTSWFVIQCIARHAAGLVLTQLELLTAALAVLNGVMYFLWWDKPLDVRCSEPVYLLEPSRPSQDPEPEEASPVHPLEPSGPSQDPEEASGFSLSNCCTTGNICAWFLWGIFGTILLPFLIASASFMRLGQIVSVSEKSSFDTYTDDIDRNRAMFWASIIAVVFGAIHCAGWAFIFPSEKELALWRISSTITTGVPFLMALFALFVILSGSRMLKYDLSAFLFPLYFGTAFYVGARLLLLTEAFISLRDLPLSAYQAVEWATFLPHI